ncbi:FeoA family protein [Thermovenabulum sp.]|uniref:FeoA family protein n=1 Tax=Thermovenabulum sp. TaxID=3100335 RepID=UPI003C7BB01F
MENREAKLSYLKIGEEATIVKIDAKDNKILKKLMALGVLPGLKVQLLQKFPTYVFKIGNTRIAADEEIAGSIIIMKNSAL